MKYQETPLHFLMHFEGNEIYIKREDLLPFSFGGNKLRIAKAFFADMEQKGGDHILAYGPVTSNLCRVIANLAAHKGYGCTILYGVDDTEHYPASSNIRLVRSFGTETVICAKTQVAENVERILAQLHSRGSKPYYIYGDMYGKGNERTPASAYYAAYDEILQQEKQQGLQFERMFLACGTGMTYGGLLAGSMAHARRQDIIGVSVARTREQAFHHVQKYMNSLAEGGAERIHIEHAAMLDYGKYNQTVTETIQHVMKHFGIALDPIYTAKAYCAMLDYIRRHAVKYEQILFIHTGGTPLFFDHIKEIYA